MDMLPTEVQFLLAWAQVQTRKIREDNDRGEMINTAIVVGILAVIAITVGVILMTKAKAAANNIKTQ